MHYFKRNIGDYHKKAGRLSMLEHGAYTLLLDACYDRECFPNLDQAHEWCWARTSEEKEAVKFVLYKFFVLSDGVYVQNRISEEIEQYNSNSTTNKRIAQEREERRRTNRTRSVNEAPPEEHEAPPNQEPRTKNQEPNTIAMASPVAISKPSRKKTTKTNIPESFAISESVAEWAKANGHSKLPERLAHFANVAKAKGYEYADWDAAFRNAITDDWAKLGKAQPKPVDGKFDMQKFLMQVNS